MFSFYCNFLFLFKILHNPIPEDCYATPEQLIHSTKQVTLATAKAVGAGNSCKQEDIIAASNVARQAVFVMLSTCRVCLAPNVFSSMGCLLIAFLVC